jgi:hypothetical protein
VKRYLGVEAEMVGMTNSWPELFQSLTGSFERTMAEQPLLLGALAAPCVLAVIGRSAIAFGLTALLLVLSIVAFPSQPDALRQWTIAILALVAGCLACLQAVRLRSSRKRMQRAEEELTQVQQELEEARGKLQREVYWRTASKGQPGTQPS